MNTMFSTQGGFVANNAVVDRPGVAPAPARTAPAAVAADDATGSGLGGQIGELAAAINAVGWNHNQVPADERLPQQEREIAPALDHTDPAAGTGLGGEIGELAAAINAVGWNHNQVPADERLPPQER